MEEAQFYLNKYGFDNGFHYNDGMFQRTFLRLIAASFAMIAFLPVQADVIRLGTQIGGRFEQAKVLASPEPVIPQELSEQNFKSFCVAKFTVDEKGKSDVKLLTTSGSSEVDEITLDTLRHWKFKPATVDDQPVTSTRKIRVEFEVE